MGKGSTPVEERKIINGTLKLVNLNLGALPDWLRTDPKQAAALKTLTLNKNDFAAPPDCTAFRALTKGEILDNFGRDDVAANVFRVMLVIHLVLYVPVDFVIVRYSLYKIFGADMKSSPRRVYVPVSCALILLALVITLATQDFGLVLDLTGGVAGAALYFIVPAVVALKAWHSRDATWYAALALGVYGAAVVLVTIVYTFVPEDALAA